MHKYLRAIGFTRPLTRDEYGSLINEAILHPAYRAATTKTYYEEAPDTFSIPLRAGDGQEDGKYTGDASDFTGYISEENRRGHAGSAGAPTAEEWLSGTGATDKAPMAEEWLSGAGATDEAPTAEEWLSGAGAPDDAPQSRLSGPESPENQPSPSEEKTAEIRTELEIETLFGEFRVAAGPSFGLSVCGTFEEDDTFTLEYAYPYFLTDNVSSSEEITVEGRIDNESYAGTVDDLRVGVTIIFRLQNIIDHMKRVSRRNGEHAPVSVSLSALSIEGTVMMPIHKTDQDRRRSRIVAENRMNLMTRARDGDENAMRDLTLEDMDNYSVVMDKIQSEDVFSLVDTYFMPYGAECDLYSVLCEIVTCDPVFNIYTGEKLYRMTLDCNGLPFDLLINSRDLYGEPAAGRRFRGIVWMQGTVHYPD